MKYILEYNQSEFYKGLYVTPIILDEVYCRFLDWYEPKVKKTISDLCSFINSKYKDILIVKMKPNIQPGLIIKEGNIQHISKDIYDFLNKRNMSNRIVYGEGTIGEITNNIHTCDIGRLGIDGKRIIPQGPKGNLLIKIGRKTDALKGKTGIFKA